MPGIDNAITLISAREVAVVTCFVPIEIHHTETPSPNNPLGVKGVGEAGVIPVAAVIANALEDALGRPVDEMPVSPLRLFELSRE